MTMRTLVAVAALAVLPLAPPNQSATSPQGKTRPFKQYTIEQFLDTTSISGASFSHDESRLLFSSNKTGIWNAYTMPVSGGTWTPVTTSTTDSTYAVSFFPNDDRVIITRDQGGNELNHLYVRTPSGDERDVTPGSNLKAQFAGWTPTGDAFYVSTNERDPKFFDIYRLEAAGYARTLVFENKDGYFPSDVSDDGKWVSLEKVNTTNDSDLFVWNAATGKTVRVSEHSGDASFSSAGFDRESKYLYYVTNDGGEFSALRRYALATGVARTFTRASGTSPSPYCRSGGAIARSASTPTDARSCRSSTRRPAPRCRYPPSPTPASRRSGSRRAKRRRRSTSTAIARRTTSTCST